MNRELEKNASEKRIEDHNGDSSRKFQDFPSSAFQRVIRGLSSLLLLENAAMLLTAQL